VLVSRINPSLFCVGVESSYLFFCVSFPSHLRGIKFFSSLPRRRDSRWLMPFPCLTAVMFFHTFSKGILFPPLPPFFLFISFVHPFCGHCRRFTWDGVEAMVLRPLLRQSSVGLYSGAPSRFPLLCFFSFFFSFLYVLFQGLLPLSIPNPLFLPRYPQVPRATPVPIFLQFNIVHPPHYPLDLLEVAFFLTGLLLTGVASRRFS